MGCSVYLSKKKKNCQSDLPTEVIAFFKLSICFPMDISTAAMPQWCWNPWQHFALSKYYLQTEQRSKTN